MENLETNAGEGDEALASVCNSGVIVPGKPEKKPLLQGWAVIDNTVGEDWNNVELSLVAGAPHSFIQQLSEPYYGRRPVVPLPESVESGQTWWEQLAPAGHAGPRITQSLPLVRNDHGRVPLPQGFVVGAVEQEATGTDTSILRLECHSEMSRARTASRNLSRSSCCASSSVRNERPRSKERSQYRTASALCFPRTTDMWCPGSSL